MILAASSFVSCLLEDYWGYTEKLIFQVSFKMLEDSR